MVVRTRGTYEMKLADGKDFEMGMAIYFPMSGNRFPLKLCTDPARHTIIESSEGAALAVIPQATSSEGIVEGTTIPLVRFHSTLDSALACLITDLNKRGAEIAIQKQKLADEGFTLGFLGFRLGNILAEVAQGKMTFEEAEAEFAKAQQSPVVTGATEEPKKEIGFHTTCTPCQGELFSTTPKKRREPKPAAKSVADIMK